MPTPTERLEARRALYDCRVCAWLATLDSRARSEWQQAILNPRFGAALVADEINTEMDVRPPGPDGLSGAAYAGQRVGEASVRNHRNRGHR